MWILMGLCIVAVLVIYVFHWIIILTDPKFRNRSSLPPGSMGFPFIGETLQFMIPSYSLDIHPFITKRIQRFGSIFRTSLFGQPIVISTDSEFNSYLMQQEGKLVELWAGPATKIFRQSDGFRIPFSNIHKYIRSITLNHIGAECIREKLISQFEEMFIKTLHQWSTQTSIDVKQSITKMNFRFFAKHYFGYDIENLSSNFERISEELFTDFTERLKTIPLNIPGTNYHKCLKVMNETLRFSILLPGILRKTLKDIHFKEYIIPANWIILAFTPNLHMNSEIYEDPLTFNPWRWKELDSFTVSKNFKPFGGGLTQCPGAELSRAFIATFLHVLVTKYRWTKIKGGKVVRNPILEFSDRIHIKIWENREKT
ncbi:cytochrome P450 87A3 isoform X2 [Arachis ipaensis]|uniref:cytochrome P450 87A3 isoform X2 n=1 Tax=Arachis ipaensis TaxID=130454 RepID=UPI000A2AF06B|nr:cytochrome P450 87A3 isoform X2 [Arachis ipaensis]